jgi:methyl-accepting chemotaxis protein
MSDFVEVLSKVELPEETGRQIFKILARTEYVLLGVPLVCALVLVGLNALLLGRFFARVTSRGQQIVSVNDQLEKVTSAFARTAEKVELGTRQGTSVAESSVLQLESMSEVVQKISTEADEANKTLRSAVEETEKSETELQQLSQSLAGLIRHSKNLEEITTVIESIAFQTNILAVNAAVEAARAGEQGRGFAIVAEAIRNLAQTSSASAKNISGLIRESGETSRKAIESIRLGVEGMTSTLELVRKSRASVGNMVAVQSQFRESISRISQSLNQLETSSQLMLGASEDVRQTRDETIKCLQEWRHAADGLGSLLLMTDTIKDDADKSARDAVPMIDSSVGTTENSTNERKKPATRFQTSALSSKPNISRESGTRAKTVNKLPSGHTQPRMQPSGSRARDVIPFEGETESEVQGDSKIGSISGF